jgi:pectate lyase
MRFQRLAIGAALVVVLAVVSGLASADDRDLGREILGPNDGWAAFSTGTTGGAAATPDHVYVVRNRKELIAALNGGI